MDVEELLQTAWTAVKKAGLPESLQEVAFKEAVAYLRDADGKGGQARAKRSQKKPDTRKPSRSSSSGSQAQDSEEQPPDEDAFFSQLASESGVDEKALKDVLQLKDGGSVHVIPPTRELGRSKAEQTRRVIALVAGAYAHGLDRSPVDAEDVRAEAKRKRCFDTANFAATLKMLKGFSSGSNRNEIMVGSKWFDEFKEAVATATGTDSGDE